MTSHELNQIDSMLTGNDPIILDEENKDMLVRFIGKIRQETFAMVRAAGLEPFDVPSWSEVMGSPASIPGFIKDCTHSIRMNERGEG